MTDHEQRQACQVLEQRVGERTAELVATMKRLQRETRQHKQTEESLAVVAQEWQDVSDVNNDAVFLLDMNHRILRCNRAMAAFVGESQEKIIGRPCCEVIHGAAEPVEGCLMVRLAKSGRRESRIVQQDDKWLCLSLDPLLDEAGNLTGAVHTIADITAQKHLEETVEAAECELQHQRVLQMHADRLRSLGEMAAGIAHELNQPLVGVRGLAEHLLLAMERGWDLPPEKVREKLTLVIAQADRMSHTVDHVRVFAREAGKPERCLVQVNDVIQSALGMLGAQLHSHDVALTTELADDLPAVLANPFSLEEVVLNLILNARHAVEQQPGRLAVPGDNGRARHTTGHADIVLRTRARRTPEQAHVEFQVIDAGTGIPADILDKVFEPFFTTKAPGQGTGLGLSICKTIVEQFEGTIELTSTEGKGTTVTVSLPAEGGS